MTDFGSLKDHVIVITGAGQGIGRAFAKAPPTERSVVFLAVTAEEKGLLGSKYYATHPLHPLARTLAMAKVGGQVNSATSQWFINTRDNLGLSQLRHFFKCPVGRKAVVAPCENL